jgi:hypothetical protein
VKETIFILCVIGWAWALVAGVFLFVRLRRCLP